MMMDRIAWFWLPVLALMILGSPETARSALILHLALDEERGSSAADSSVNALHGTLVNMDDTDWVAGQAGNALDFDGVDDYVDVGDHALLDFGTQDFTVSYWVVKQATSNVVFDNTYSAAKWGSGALPGTNEWVVNIGFAVPGTQTDRPHISVEIGTTIFAAVSPDLLSLDEWHHIVGVREGQSLRIYMDGTLRGVNDTLPANASINNVGRDLRIAANSDPNNLSVRTDAIFDDFQIYSQAITDEEVRFLFDNPGLIIPEPTSGTLVLTIVATLLGNSSRRRRRIRN